MFRKEYQQPTVGSLLVRINIDVHGIFKWKTLQLPSLLMISVDKSSVDTPTCIIAFDD